MTEPIGRDALFGVDGTQLPDPLPAFPDALTGPGRAIDPDVDMIAPIRVPPSPDARAIREAAAAALADEPSTRRVAPPRRAAYPQPVTRPHGSQPPGAHPPGVIPPARPLLRRRPAIPTPHSVQRARSSFRTGCVIGLVIFGVVVFSLFAEFGGAVAHALR
ncbi:MAG: hypothetical protein ACRDRZ_11885 [Pseudonocardiaceae bacterium]